jgi:two-component system, cell cycle sensor histidine kinase and response regulator CckA
VRKSKTLPRQNFELVPDAIVVTDTDGNIVLVNTQAESMFGYSRDELLGKPLEILMPVLYREKHAQHRARYFSRPTSRPMGAGLELYGKRKDGSEFPVDIMLSPLETEDGLLGLSVIRDISDRKRAEEALRRAHDQLELRVQERTAELLKANEELRLAATVMHDSNDAITIQDFEGRILGWNRGAERMYGYTKDEALALNVFRIVPHNLVKEHARLRERLANGEAVESFETQKVAKGGRIVDVWLTATALLDGSGKPMAVATTERDITERKRAEQALRESEERYRSLVETAGSAIICLSPDHKIIEWNREAERISGCSRTEVLGKDYFELFLPEENWKGVAADIKKVLEGENTRGYENSFRARDGKERILLWNVSSLPGIAGKPVGVIAVGQDITERKQIDEQRRKLEEQLSQSQKMEALGRLAGGIVHDVNNLLTGVMAFSEILLEQLPENDPLREGAEEARKTCERSALLTRQLLAVSRRQSLEPIVLDLNAVITDMTRMLRHLIGEHIDLVTELEPKLGPVKADPGKIEQVILNLAVNARDAMPEGGRLTIETANVIVDEDYALQHVQVLPGPNVMLTVGDTGVGMEPNTLAHIFEPFFTTKEWGKGTGLGLSIVYGIVRQSEGTIGVYSTPGHGTTFKIYLPMVEHKKTDIEAEPFLSWDARGSETILVVEDDNVVRMAVSKTLRGHGYTVLEASNRADALVVCERHRGPIHLLVTDVVMPQMSGPEFATRLAPLHPETKVLYMSAHILDTLVYRRVLEQGTPFLEKPFTRIALMRKVREILDQDRSAADDLRRRPP